MAPKSRKHGYPVLHLLTCDCPVAKVKQDFLFSHLIYGAGKSDCVSKNYRDNYYPFLVFVGDISRFVLCEFGLCNQLYLVTGLNHGKMGG